MGVADYSWERPSPRALRDAGYTAVMRYCSHEPGKDLSPGERDALWAEGLAIGLVWETTANRAGQGGNAGLDDCAEFNGRLDLLGWPADQCVAYAVDYAPTDFRPIRDYFTGAISLGRRPVGGYGNYQVIEDLGAYRPLDCYWQTAGLGSGAGQGSGGSVYIPAYGYGVRLSRHACMMQFWDPVPVVPGTDHNQVISPVAMLYHPDMENDDVANNDEVLAAITAAKNEIGGWLQGERGYSGQTLIGLADGGVYLVWYDDRGDLKRKHIVTPDEVTLAQTTYLAKPVVFAEVNTVWGDLPRAGLAALSTANADFVRSSIPLIGAPAPVLSPSEIAQVVAAITAAVGHLELDTHLGATDVAAIAEATADEIHDRTAS